MQPLVVSIRSFDTDGCSATASVLVEVLEPAIPEITLIDTNILQASDAQTYQWYVDGNIITGAESQTYTAQVSGIYTVETTDSNGCISGANFELEVSETLISLISPSINSSYCFGETLVIDWLSNNVEDIDILISTDGGEDYFIVGQDIVTSPYLWEILATFFEGDQFYIKLIDDNNSAIETIGGPFSIHGSNMTQNSFSTCNPDDAGFFEEVLTNQNGCDSIVQTTVFYAPFESTISYAVTCDAAQEGIVIDTLSTLLGCDSIVTTIYEYTENEITGLPNEALICTGEELPIYVYGGENYNWAPPIGLSNTNTSNPVASPTESTLYTVTAIHENGCTSTASIQINVDDPPQPNITIGIGDTLISSEAFSYQWYLDDVLIPGANSQYYMAIASGEYTVETTNENGCVTSNSISNYTVSISTFGFKFLSVFPNPSKDYVKIEFETIHKFKDFKARIVDLSGKILYQYNEENVSNRFDKIIDTSDFPAGVYTIQFYTEDSMANHRLIVVR